jgi:AAA family ATP:ADP antiporter
VGAYEAGLFIDQIGVLELMLVGAGLLVVQVLLTNYIDRRERGRPRQAAPSRAAPDAAGSPPPSKTGAFGLVFKTRYLLLIALLLTLQNWIKTTGEYILGDIVRDNAIAELGAADTAAVGRTIGAFYSDFFTYVNILGLLLQMFVVSRIIRYLKVPVALVMLPVISLTVYGIIAFVPLLRAVLVAKVAENSMDYSLNNTVRNMLFLPCTTEQKYSAKQAIDSFFVRLGDVLSAAVVFVGVQWMAFSATTFALVNAVLVNGWLWLAWRVGRQYAELSASGRPPVTSA